MENEIKVGEYIRDNKGFIFKVAEIDFDEEANQNYYKGSEICSGCFQEMIKKHSLNIIDLIEKGDYVNGQKITKITLDPFIKGQIDLWTDRTIPFGHDYEQERFIENEIETIVTKELMERLSYKVERSE